MSQPQGTSVDPARYHKHISAKRPFFSLDMREVWRYRDLTLFYSRKSLVTRYKQTILGPLWLFLAPFAASILQLFVFGNLAGFATDGVPKILFYVFSNAVWTYFAEVLTNNSNIFFNNGSVFSKVYFPRLAISFSITLSALVPLAIQFVIGAAFLVYYAVQGAIAVNLGGIVLILLPLIQLTLLAQGLGLVFASITTRYRDLRVVFNLITRALMFLSPVVYSLAQIPEGTLKLAYLANPIAPGFELFRHFLWNGPMPPLPSICSALLVTALIWVFGVLMFNRIDRTFVDTI